MKRYNALSRKDEFKVLEWIKNNLSIMGQKTLDEIIVLASTALELNVTHRNITGIMKDAGIHIHVIAPRVVQRSLLAGQLATHHNVAAKAATTSLFHYASGQGVVSLSKLTAILYAGIKELSDNLGYHTKALDAVVPPKQ